MVPALVRGEGEDRRATEAVLGLTGPWGSGKSSVLNLLAEKLGAMANVAVVRFNPWLVGSRDDLLMAMLKEMQLQLGRSNKQFAKNVAQAVHRYRKVLAPAASFIPAFGQALAEAMKGLPAPAPRSPTEARTEVEKTLRDANGAIVVLIDEFDRLEPGEMRAMGQAIKAALDLPNISWVIALDSDKTIEALNGENKEWALGFLAKVITVNIPLRPLTDEDKGALLQTFLNEAGGAAAVIQSDLYPELLTHMCRVLKTPRDVRRVSATFAAIHAMLGKEVNIADQLAWATLGAIRPDLQRRIADNIEHFAPNPLDDMRKRPATTTEALGLDNADPMANLICFLFPRFRSGWSEDGRVGRVARRSNAWNLIWLGVPPFHASTDDVRRFWAEPSDKIIASFSDSKQQDLRQRTYAMLPELPEEKDLDYWRFLIDHEQDEELILRDQFLRAAMRSEEMKRRMLAVFERLRESNDLVLVPAILMNQAARFGFKPSPRRDEPDFLSEEEVRTLIQPEVEK